MTETNRIVNDLARTSHLLLGIKLKIWECAYSEDSLYSALYSAWLNYGFIDSNGRLTELGVELTQSSDFIQYELNIACDNSTQAHPKTVQQNYVLLRRALGMTFLKDVRQLFIDTAKQFIVPGDIVLDLAGGDGQYLSSLKTEIPDLKLHLIDKHNQVNDKDIEVSVINFLEDDKWSIRYVSRYNVVLANEIVHCLNDRDISRFLRYVKFILKKGGKFIVGEQMPSSRLNVRMAAYTNGKMYRQFDMRQVILGSGNFKLLDVSAGNNHYFLTFEVVA